MTINYVNGQWIEARDAMVPMEDRGHQFGDGVYDVAAYFNRNMVDAEMHIERLIRSLREIRIPNPKSAEEWQELFQTAIDKNDYEHGGVYVQVTRGAYSRDHVFPLASVEPAITMSVFKQKTPSPEMVQKGCYAITQPDLRWKRCDIKTINLLPNLLAKQAAVEAGAREAVLLKENGEISEGAVANIMMVKQGRLITHQANNEILNGITRRVVLELAAMIGIAIEERPFTFKELIEEGDEIFLTSTTSNVLPISKIDDHIIGNGVAGPVALQLLNAYLDHIEQQTGFRPE